MNLSYFGLFFILCPFGYIALHSGFFYFVYIPALLCFDDVLFVLECMKLFYKDDISLQFSAYQMKNTNVMVYCDEFLSTGLHFAISYINLQRNILINLISKFNNRREEMKGIIS